MTRCRLCDERGLHELEPHLRVQHGVTMDRAMAKLREWHEQSTLADIGDAP